ncbi:hypothetical protein HYPSUDRAFT_66321 [Hypholoma sublateritium FD-334 SS-4]|uniref:Carboxymuconolactone decarboxylase-like domain-containing protein n=1 Tax=Hypholoma sublateritium (strain FD-334 SS-4) TaxID=945553 RepID=A0A0D2P3R9_HYPSF|nr:hypothetical protein HYPSUDRAFT_66321 [Hypholoma sublateritium FD-334 SS-4]
MTRPNEDAHKELFDAGMAVRRKVMGDEFIDNMVKQGVSDFMRPMQQLATEAAWGTIWTRPGLELKQRSLIVIALLASQGRENELAHHIRGAITDGCTEVEIQETLLQTAIYSGMPTGMSSFRAADALIKKLKEEGKL